MDFTKDHRIGSARERLPDAGSVIVSARTHLSQALLPVLPSAAIEEHRAP
jgi:hypothetical protein